MISIIAATAILSAQTLPEADFGALQVIKNDSLNQMLNSACGGAAPASYSGWLGRQPVTPGKIQELLGPQEVFVDYTFVPADKGYKPGLYGSVIAKSGDQLTVKTKLLAEIDEAEFNQGALNHAQAMISGAKEPGDAWTEAARNSLLLKSFSPLLFPTEFKAELGSAKSIVVSPHRSLWGVCFQTLQISSLPTPESRREVVESIGKRRVFKFVQSASSWSFFRSRTAELTGAGIAALAVPAVDVSRVSSDSPLGRAISADSRGLSADSRSVDGSDSGIGGKSQKREEARSVLDSQDEKGEIVDDQFTFGALQNALSTKQTVLVGAHWLMAPNASAISGIIVSQGADKAPDVVTAARLGSIAGQAERVIYTFSDIVFGQALNPDPFSSLMIATLNTGAKTVLATQWRASDSYSEEILKVALKKVKTNPSMSLSQAVFESRSEVAPRPGDWHPYYWARFMSIEG